MAESDRTKWDRRYHRQEEPLLTNLMWIEEFDDQIPRFGAGLDVAAGSGGLALWLAGRGLRVTAVDISPVGLGLLQRSADNRRLPIEIVVSDLEIDGLPEQVFQVVTCFRYWQPDLFPAIQHRLGPGGIFLGEVATKQNLEKHDHPSSRYLAEPEALRTACSPLEIIYYEEGWFDDRASARVVARKR